VLCVLIKRMRAKTTVLAVPEPRPGTVYVRLPAFAIVGV
jgi:hypothetical protein